jgi:predicted SnoaL-like aldol condensation-catalyzing enzyme
MVPINREKMNLHGFITNICHALPKGVISIEDIIIKGNQVEVRYKTEHDQDLQALSSINNSRVVTVNSYDALRLFDGKVMEHRDSIYQIKTA